MKKTKIRFDPAGHQYFEGELEIPSLSRVLALGGLGPDLSKIPPHVLARKRDIGTAVHLAIRLHLEGLLDWSSVDRDVLPYLHAALRYFEKEERRIISIEAPYGGSKLGYACTPDLVVEGGVIEWKTTYSIYPEVEIQLAGQALAVTNGRNLKEQRRRVVQLKKTGEYVVKDYGADEDETFRAVLRIAKWRLRHESRRLRSG